jgi:hypothetical protein
MTLYHHTFLGVLAEFDAHLRHRGSARRARTLTAIEACATVFAGYLVPDG